MKTVYWFLIFSFLLISNFRSIQARDFPENVQMGVSQINITPEVPVLMSGYEARKTPFTGVHDSLYASALYFKDEKTSLLLITADVIGYNRIFIDDTRKKISENIGIPEENIMITAVHNHGGPVTKAYEKKVPEEVEKYVETLQQNFISLAETASKNTFPFRMGMGKSSCEMNINRRAEFADGAIWLGRDQGKICDHDLDVIKFENMNKQLIAVLINWPCHATTSGQENYQITGDWPGAAARYIKSKTDKKVAVAITIGASGDINPIYGPGKNFNEIEAVGYHVGKNAWNIFNEISTLPVKSLNSQSASIKLPGKISGKDHFPPKSYEPAAEVEINFTAFKIGNLILTGISGEVMNEIGLEVKKQSPYNATLLVTHCNGSSGYICTDKAFTEGGYEVKVTHLMPGAEKPITEKVLQMINSL